MPFVLHSVSFLKPGGRLGLVLPAELLTNYAAPLRSFLMASFSSVRLATFDEPVFPRCKKRSSFFWPMAEGGVMLVYYLAAVRRYCRSCLGKLALYQPPSEGARWSGLFVSSDSLSSLGRLTGAGEPSLCPNGALCRWGP